MSRGIAQEVNYAIQTELQTIPVKGWKNLPFKTFSITPSYERTESELITGGRLPEAGAVTKATVEGDISTNLAKGLYDDFLAAAALAEWTGDVLTIGGDWSTAVQKMFAIESLNKDVKIAHYYGGCRVNKLDVKIADGYAELTINFMGSDYQNKEDSTYSVTPTAAPKPILYATRLSVEDIMIDGVTTKGNACATEFTFSISNDLLAQDCLGGGIFTTTFLDSTQTVTGNLTLAYGKKSQSIVNNQISGKTIAINVKLKFSDGTGLTINVPAAQVTASNPNGGTKDVLSTALEYNAVNGTQLPTITRTLTP